MGATLGPSKVSSSPESREMGRVRVSHTLTMKITMMLVMARILTLNDLVVGEVQVEQEQHVQQSQSPTEQQARGLTNRAGQ